MNKPNEEIIRMLESIATQLPIAMADGLPEAERKDFWLERKQVHLEQIRLIDMKLAELDGMSLASDKKWPGTPEQLIKSEDVQSLEDKFQKAKDNLAVAQRDDTGNAEDYSLRDARREARRASQDLRRQNGRYPWQER